MTDEFNRLSICSISTLMETILIAARFNKKVPSGINPERCLYTLLVLIKNTFTICREKEEKIERHAVLKSCFCVYYMLERDRRYFEKYVYDM